MGNIFPKSLIRHRTVNACSAKQARIWRRNHSVEVFFIGFSVLSVGRKTSLILHTTVYFTNELRHSCTCDLSTSSFLTPEKMKCNKSCQCQDLYRKRDLSLPGEPKTCPSLSPITRHRSCFLIYSSSMGRLKTYTQTQTEGEHMGEKNPEALEKQERNFHSSWKYSLQCSVLPKHRKCYIQEKLSVSQSPSLPRAGLLAGMPDTQQYFPFVIFAALKEIQQFQKSLWGAAIKDHFKNLAEGKEISDGAGAWDTLIQPTLFVEEWGLCE